MLDDFSRYIVTWKLCSTMTDSDVTATLETRLAEQFDAYARTDTPLRYIVRDTGLNREECKYLLRIGRDDIEREQRGELTSRQLAARERAEHWRKVRESVEAARAARAAPPKKRGRPRKVRVL